MGKKKKRLLYSIFVVCIAVFFMYYLFPSDKAAEYITCKVSGISPDVHVTIDTVRPVFPFGLRLEGVSLYYGGNPVIKAERVNVRPGLLTLMCLKHELFFRISACEGVMKGSVKREGRMPGGKISMDMTVSDIRIDDILPVREISGYKLSGLMDGDILYTNDPEKGETITSRLTLQDCDIELEKPIFDQDMLTFSDVKAAITISTANRSNRRIEIKECSAEGDQVSGAVSGLIDMKNPVDESRLDLTGTIVPNPGFLDDMRSVFPVDIFLKNRSGSKGFPFRLSGTAGKPAFSLN